jgi:Metallo-peptidase family M12B Reprolysin-like
MESIRSLAQCINLGNPNDFRVVRDFFGYKTGVPKIIEYRIVIPIEKPNELSLLQQVRRIKQRHIHLNLIRVGSESFTNNDEQIPNDEQKIDRAVQITREIYGHVSFGIGRVEHYFIRTADANGREYIDSDAQAMALTDEWTVPNDALDIFLVLTYDGNVLGSAPKGGSCNKNANGMTGCVVVMGPPSRTGFVLGHEVGHYLGLPHFDDIANLMHDGYDPEITGSGLTSGQRDVMRAHCFTDPGC